LVGHHFASGLCLLDYMSRHLAMMYAALVNTDRQLLTSYIPLAQ